MKIRSDLTNKIKTLEAKVSTLKTKKAIEKCHDKIHSLRLQLHDVLYAEIGALNHVWDGWHDAQVCYSTESEGMAKIDGLGFVYFNACNDENSKSWYNETCCIEFIKGQKISVKIKFDISHDSIVIVTEKLKGGTLNQKKYQELSKKPNLAFFRYPNSAGVTGLIA